MKEYQRGKLRSLFIPKTGRTQDGKALKYRLVKNAEESPRGANPGTVGGSPKAEAKMGTGRPQGKKGVPWQVRQGITHVTILLSVISTY